MLETSFPSEDIDTLIARLKESMILRSSAVENAFRFVDRKHFVKEHPYHDTSPTLMERKIVTCISTPRIHVLAAEILLQPLSSAKLCLDIGSGSGYFTALMQVLAPQSKVFAIDYHEAFIDKSKVILEKHYPSEFSKITFIKGDGKNGIDGKKFDVIHIGFMCSKIPIELLKQLAIGGRILVPVSNGQKCSFDEYCLSGSYLCIDKINENETLVTDLFNCSFVPDAC